MNPEEDGRPAPAFDLDALEVELKGDTPKPKKPNGDGQHLDAELAPLPSAFSDDALAVEWVKLHGDDWRYVPDLDRWLEWDGSGWQRVIGNKYFELARILTREALAWPHAQDLTKTDRRRINSATMASAMLRWLKSDPRIELTSEHLDRDPLLLGVPGGVLDLKHCKLIAAERSQFTTKRAAVAPDHAPPKRWLEFLAQVTQGDTDLSDYLQRFAGYCMTGMTNEHALAFLYGTGANGKTTFAETLLGILGQYAITTGMETLSESHTERHTTEIARFMGARLIASEETASGSKWNEGRIKRLTGGGRIAARFMRCDDIEFEMQGKFLIAGNHKPALRADEAMKRRIHLVPFLVTIPEADRDRDLMAKLRAEWPQILNWMLQGCAAWQDYGLAPGERIREATDKYLKNNDILGAWMDDRTEADDARTLNDGRILHADFCQWCDEQGEKPWSRRAWSDAMLTAGLQDGRTKHVRGFYGVKLRVSASPTQQPDYYNK